MLLTNADVDHAAGLLALRERQRFTIWGTRSTLDTIGANRIFDVVAHDIVPRRAVKLGEPFEPLPGLSVELFPVPGKVPLWLEEGEVKTDEIGEGTVGVAVEAAGRRLVYAPGCARATDDLHRRIAAAHALFFDGTLFSDDEMIANGLGDKTGRRMGHMPVSGPGGTLDELARHARVRKILIHINNSNPILIEGSPEEAKVKAAGWDIAFDGMEVRPMNELTLVEPLSPDGLEAAAARDRPGALSRPASLPRPAARRQAQQGPGAGLGAQPLRLPGGDPAQGRRP